MNTERLYTENEISALLKRAGELHSEHNLEETSGLSLTEIQQIASDVGLDPRLIEAAAREMDGYHLVDQESHGGIIKRKINQERIITGEFLEDEWGDISSEIGRIFNLVGTSTRVGKTYEWTYASRQANLQVKLTPSNGQTKIRIVGDFSRTPFAYLLFRLFFSGFYAFVLASALTAGSAIPLAGVIGIGVAFAATVYSIMHFGYASWVGKRERASEQLLKRLDQILLHEQPIEPATLDASLNVSSEKEARLDLSDVDQEIPEQQNLSADRNRERGTA